MGIVSITKNFWSTLVGSTPIPVILSVDDLLQHGDSMDDAQFLQALELLLHYNPALLSDKQMQALLREVKAAGGVINVPVLPPNVDPATTWPGCQWRDWNGRLVDGAGTVIGGPDPRIILPAPDVVQEMPKAFGFNWGKQR